VFSNDPTIPGDEGLLRRIHAQQLVPDERHSGRVRVSSAAFRDVELSIVIKSTLLISGRQPADLLQTHPNHALVAITAAKARSLNQAVARDPELDEPAHGVVHGRKSKKCASELANSAEWVVPSEAPAVAR
jgi:hypothetical protein